MIITDDINVSCQSADNIVIMGMFDGVHLSHKKALHEAVNKAMSKCSQLIAVVIQSSFVTEAPRSYLTTYEERKQMLENCGVDQCLLIPYLEEKDVEKFICQFLKERLGACTVVLADKDWIDSCSADVLHLISENCIEEDISFHIADEVTIGDEVVCSETISKKLTDGDVVGAARMLGYNYTLEGIVVGGHRKGRELGFPTANLSLDDTNKIIPKRGVYATNAVVADSSPLYQSMTNIGVRPTFEGSSMTVETHILDFSDEIYGEKFRISFLRHIRDERRFESISDLVNQLKADAERVRSN